MRQLPDVAVPLEEGVDFVLVNAPRQPHVPVDGGEAEERQVAPRQALEEGRELRFGDVVGTPGDHDREPRGILLQQLVGIAEREPVVGVHVEPPQQVFLPRRQHVGVDRADVGERHQAQQLEPLFRADEIGKLLDDVRIVEVAAEGDLRHQQVIADQELDRPARVGRAARADRACSARAARSPARARRRATCRRRGTAARA